MCNEEILGKDHTLKFVAVTRWRSKVCDICHLLERLILKLHMKIVKQLPENVFQGLERLLKTSVAICSSWMVCGNVVVYDFLLIGAGTVGSRKSIHRSLFLLPITAWQSCSGNIKVPKQKKMRLGAAWLILKVVMSD